MAPFSYSVVEGQVFRKELLESWRNIEIKERRGKEDQGLISSRGSEHDGHVLGLLMHQVGRLQAVL